jgi:hypothetical protein
MPIRFRCRYCNQLMGIARRKAGTTVQCPTCRGQLVVPHQSDGVDPAAAEAPPFPVPAPPALAPRPAAMPNPGTAPLFERSDFDAFLKPPVKEAPPPAQAPLPPQPPPAPAYERQALSEPSISVGVLPQAQAGVLLTPTQATMLTVAAILLFALAFGAGLLVGHYWMG